MAKTFKKEPKGEKRQKSETTDKFLKVQLYIC